MSSLSSSQSSSLPFALPQLHRRGAHLLLGAMISLLGVSGLPSANAQQPQPSSLLAASPAAPAQLGKVLTAMDTAANQQKLSRYMRFYDPGFTHGDGFTRSSVKQTTKTFWDQYSNLTYTTQIVNWQPAANGGYLVTTNTQITGNRIVDNRPLTLEATIESQQQWINDKLIRQTILSEQSQIISGQNPPNVTVQLPKTVKAGDDFNFDVILDEPLGERVVLGTALATPVTAEGILNTPTLELEPLPAGGLFKIGKAPKQTPSEWVSAVLIQDGGMTIINRRLRIVK